MYFGVVFLLTAIFLPLTTCELRLLKHLCSATWVAKLLLGVSVVVFAVRLKWIVPQLRRRRAAMKERESKRDRSRETESNAVSDSRGALWVENLEISNQGISAPVNKHPINTGNPEPTLAGCF